MKHCYIATAHLYLSNQEKIRATFAVQVCGNKKSFAVGEVQKIAANVPQICGFVVVDHLLLFYGICGCRIECEFAVPSIAKKPFNCSARGQKSIVVDKLFLYRCISKGIIFCHFRWYFYPFCSIIFFWFRLLKKQPKTSSLLTDSTSLSLSPLSLLAPLEHNSTC